MFKSHIMRHKTITMNTKLPRVQPIELITEDTIQDYEEILYILKTRVIRFLTYCTDSPENNNLYIRCTFYSRK